MQSTPKSDVQQVVNSIKKIKSSLEAEGEVSLLEFEWNGNEECAYLVGNSVGLMHLARHVLELTLKDFDGAHIHFDEHSNFPEGSDALIIMKKSG